MNTYFKLLITIVLVAALSPIAWAADDAVLATVSSGPNQLIFQPYSSDSGHTLRVSCGAGDIFEEQFAAGVMPSYAPIDRDGFLLPDGVCSYELRSLPAVEGAEGEAGQTDVQFGSFEIASGQIVDADFTKGVDTSLD